MGENRMTEAGEIMEEREKKIEKLIEYADRLRTASDKAALFEQYRPHITDVVPKDIFEMQTARLKAGMSHEEGIGQAGMLINAFHKALSSYSAKRIVHGGFLESLREENEELEKRLIALQPLIKQMQEEKTFAEMVRLLDDLGTYEIHMKKVENILFPVLEKADPRYEGTSLMWTMHDRVRDTKKQISAMMKTVSEAAQKGETYFSEALSGIRTQLNKLLGVLFVSLSGLKTMQGLILLPCAADEIDEKADKELLLESFEYGFAWIAAPDKEKLEKEMGGDRINMEIKRDGKVDLGTGRLDVEQLIGVFSAMPVDLTFVDANDKVAFFSRPKDRIFPRSVSVIGRDVRKCHPADSVHIVEDILEGFKSGEREQESFWIQMRGKFLLIQYFAVRSEDGAYLGTLEVSQEISEIKKLEGEKRLLDR